MKWAQFLHIYQPADQQKDVLEAVIAQSYRPLFTHFKENNKVRLTLNINGALLELFDKNGHQDLINTLREAGKKGHIEFTGSAKYHAFLPLLVDEEIKRQIRLNNETNSFYLGDAYKPRGFFSPEMGYKPELAKIVEDAGFEWMILDEITAYGGKEDVDYTKLYRIEGTKLNAFFRERRSSNLIMSAAVRSIPSLKQAMKDDLKTDRYLITAMDGETFGHHRPGLEQLLFSIFSSSDFNLITISELKNFYSETLNISPVSSTWASSRDDIDKKIEFLSWSDPDNEIHSFQWQLLDLVLKEIQSLPIDQPQYLDVRNKMDKAEASDHFWWASAKPWWSLEMVEEGAYLLLDTLHSIPNISKEEKEEASILYQQIVSKGFSWQRTGKIRDMFHAQNETLRIPFKDRTIGKGGAEEGVYYAFITMMKEQEKEAVEKGEYEKAILWRDAIVKLDQKLDIYDAVNAIDLLRNEVPHEDVEKIIAEHKDRYQHMRGGQPEQRGS